jgi:hypothetical protein
MSRYVTVVFKDLNFFNIFQEKCDEQNEMRQHVGCIVKHVQQCAQKEELKKGIQ